VVSSKIFSWLDAYLWKLTYKWAKHSHPNKSKTWLVDRYFGKFNKFRNDRWVFGDPALVSAQGGVVHLLKFSWTNIVRHQTVKGTASPDDPALIDYWAARRRRIKPPLDSYTLHLLDRQDSRCPLCGDPVARRRPATQLTPALGELVAGGHPQGHPARLPRAPRTARTTRQSGR
jgi:Group II intron, maturase-specific domain.